MSERAPLSDAELGRIYCEVVPENSYNSTGLRAVADAVRADAWDEGYKGGYYDSALEDNGNPDADDEYPHVNPYRAQLTQQEDRT